MLGGVKRETSLGLGNKVAPALEDAEACRRYKGRAHHIKGHIDKYPRVEVLPDVWM